LGGEKGDDQGGRRRRRRRRGRTKWEGCTLRQSIRGSVIIADERGDESVGISMLRDYIGPRERNCRLQIVSVA